MKSIYTLIFCITAFLAALAANAQATLENLIPKPRQAYIREVYSGMFSITNKPLYLNSTNPLYKAAYEFNAELRKRGLDTLQIYTNYIRGSSAPGINLDTGSKEINYLLNSLPDQPLEVSSSYPGAEGYVLDILPSEVLIAGSDLIGLHYGILTFFQLLDQDAQKRSIFACRIVDAPEFPVRWFYYPNNHLVGANITKAKGIWNTAAQYKLNGVNLTDYKFGFISTMPQRYYDSLLSVKKFAEENYLKIIAGIFSFGYSGNILYHNPNWASGLPVRMQKFFIEGDTGLLVPHVNVAYSNGGFENHNGNNFPGFLFIDKPGEKSFVDTDIKHSGSASVRFENFEKFYPSDGNARVVFRTKAQPFTLYHASAWVRTENLGADDSPRLTIIGNKNSSLNFASTGIPWNTNGWKKVDITFNSLDSDTLLVYWGVWGARSGKIWWDDLALEEVSFINLLRRSGTPVTVTHPILDVVYTEGQDYDTLRDPKTGYLYSYPGDFSSYHQPPAFKIKKSGMLKNGDTVLISYYHAVIVYDGQVMVTMSEPDLYTTIEKEFKILDSVLKPETYFMEHDEIRTMNWDYGDQSRGLTPAQILADNVNKCVDIVHGSNPAADIWLWSDMFDEYHNAVPKNYYLVNGDLTGSADLIPKSLGISNWNSGKANNSLNFFSDKGFRQICAPYYDQNENHIRRWKEWAQNTPDFQGMLYTTWTSNYNYLRHFAEYSWNHAPYVYHYPLSQNPNGEITFDIKISGDPWDAAWSLDNAQLLYRNSPEMRFTAQDFTAEPDKMTAVKITMPDTNKWLQYYITATDNRGWTTRIPFGANVYYEMGERPVSVVVHNFVFDFRIIGIYPNPTRANNKISIEWEAGELNNYQLKIYNCLSQGLINMPISVDKAGIQRTNIDINNFTRGVYILTLEGSNRVVSKKFVVSE